MSDTPTIAALLGASELFTGLSEQQRLELASRARPVTLRRNDVLFAENDHPTALYLTVEGRIAISNKSTDGRESMVALMEAGDLFGEMPLFDGLGRSAEARALEPSEVVEVPYDPIIALFDAHPELYRPVVAMLARRLRAMDSALADSVFLDVSGRTAKRLLELAGDADEFTLPITQEELAGMIGASRERVNKAIASFIKLGWLEQRDGSYLITNREQLTIRAN